MNRTKKEASRSPRWAAWRKVLGLVLGGVLAFGGVSAAQAATTAGDGSEQSVGTQAATTQAGTAASSAEAGTTGVSASEAATGATTTPTTTSADFTVTDSTGETVNLSKQANGNFLFVTTAVDIAKVTIASAKPITAASRGTVATDAKSVTADFSTDETITITTSNADAASVSDADASAADAAATAAATPASTTSTTITVRQSTLPSLYLDLADGTTLSSIHANKGTKHEGNRVVLTDTANSKYDLDKTDVEVKGRGNTSWQLYDKKGYQIKFSKKTSVLGMDKAKKWVLLANSSDPSMVKNKTSFDLSSKLGASFTPNSQFVDLWIEGDYRGTYEVTDKVEIGSSRVDIDDATGVVSELDTEFYRTETYSTDRWGRQFTLKDPDVEDSEAVKGNFDAFIAKLDKFEEALDSHAEWDTITGLADVNSIATYYLINEFTANDESTATSQYWTWDGGSDTLHMGPSWDFDTSMEAQSSPNDYYFYQDRVISALENYQQFRQIVTSEYTAHKADFDAAPTDAKKISEQISESADMNYMRWNSYNTTVGKNQHIGANYEACAKTTIDWLTARAQQFRPNAQLMYRLYNPNSGEHFYTASRGEKASVVAAGWHDEGSAWTAPLGSDAPVYRLYNPNAGDHHYTTSVAERDWLVGLGWKYEGIGWYSAGADATPVYRAYNPNAKSGAHHFTTSGGEISVIVGLGWRSEGIAWYGL